MSLRSAMRYSWPWLLAIFLVTLSPGGEGGGTPSAFCVLCGSNGGADLLLNVLLFVPLGFTLARGRMRPLQALLIGGLVSAGVELAQFLLPDRAPTLRDVVTNASGAGLGAFIFCALPQLLRRSRVSVASLLLSVALPGAFSAATAWLLGPTLRPTARLQSIWSPEFARRGNRWDGRIESVTLGGTAMPDGPVAVTPAVREAITSGAPLRIVAQAAPGRVAYMPILRLAPEIDESLIIVSQAGESIVIFPRSAAADLRLRTPGVRFPDVLRNVRPGERMEIVVHPWTGAEPCVSVNGRLSCAPAAHAARGWAFFLPSQAGPPGSMDLLSLASLFLPLALVAPAFGRGPYLAALAGATAALALAIHTSGFSSLRAADAMAVLFALAAGALLRRRVFLRIANGPVNAVT